MKNTSKIVSKPVLEFHMKDGAVIRIWVLNPGESVKCTSAPCHYFLANKTASLIYDDNRAKSGGGHTVTEYNLDEKTIWQWVAEWMEKGFRSENLMLPAQCESPVSNDTLAAV